MTTKTKKGKVPNIPVTPKAPAKKEKEASRHEAITIIRNGEKKIRQKIVVATATLGIIRMEWAAARFSQVIPCNWSSSSVTSGLNTAIPMGYLVADAQNIAIQDAIDRNFDWLFLHEDDVVLSHDCFLRLNEYMRDGSIPVISGLYYTKSEPSEPILYRGRGNSYYGNWKFGDKVWVDGVPTGCLLISMRLIKEMYKDAEKYTAFNRPCRKVFDTPGKVWFDPETGHMETAMGTSDLYWCDWVLSGKYLKKAGFDKVCRKKNPFLVDTKIFCKHIDLNSGRQYPAI